MKKVHELRQKRAALSEQAKAILAKDTMAPEDEAQFDAIMAEADALGATIARLDKAEALETATAARLGERADAAGTSDDEQADRETHEAQAFSRFLAGGMESLAPEDRAFMARRFVNPQAAQSVGTAGAGGYTVPAAFYDTLTQALLAYGGMRNVATVIKTEAGQTLPMPTVNETAQMGAILAENTQVAAQDAAFGVVNLGAFMYSSKLVLVSFQLMNDSAFNLDAYLANALGTRIARIHNNHFTVGVGTTQPMGAVTASASGKVGTTGQTTSVIYDDLVDLIHSVDPLYRPGARFMMHDSSVKALRKIKDTTGRPIWTDYEAGMAPGVPPTLLGFPVEINQDMPVMSTNAKSILFGAFDTYMIRDVLGVQVMRLTERYADYGQVGFLAWARADGNLLNAGTNPLKYYQNSAT